MFPKRVILPRENIIDNDIFTFIFYSSTVWGFDDIFVLDYIRSIYCAKTSIPREITLVLTWFRMVSTSILARVRYMGLMRACFLNRAPRYNLDVTQ